MGFDAVFVEAADAEVVHTDGHDALNGEILRRVGAEGDEVLLLGVCFLREAPERAIGSDRRAGKWGLAARSLLSAGGP